MLQFLLPKITMNIGRRARPAQTNINATLAIEFARFQGEVLARVNAVEKIQGEQARQHTMLTSKLDDINIKLAQILVRIDQDNARK